MDKRDHEAVAKAIMGTQIDPAGLAVKDFLDDDQSAQLYLVILDALNRASGDGAST